MEKKILISANKGRRLRTLPAGVLPLVLAIALVVAVLCSAAVLLVYYHKLIVVDIRLDQQLRDNTKSGYAYALASLEELPEREWVVMDLFEKEQDSLRIRKEAWGAFEILQVEAFKGERVERKVGLAGIRLAPDKAALYLEDQRRPISLAGEAKLTGNVYLPKAGIKADYVNRKGYSRDKLVYGEIFGSKPSLPEPEQERVKHLQALLQGGKANAVQPAVAKRSFFQEEGVLIYREEAIVWKDSLLGKIRLQSATEIVVEPEAYLRDVILSAPKITFKAGFEGQLQAFAGDTLVLEEGVKLLYPSVAGVLARSNRSLLHCAASAELSGLLFQYGDRQSQSFHLVRLEKNSKIEGEVWSNGYVEHQGTVEGTLTCRKFYLQTPATIYENYLFNGKIDRPALSSYFAGSALINPEGEKSIIKWLY